MSWMQDPVEFAKRFEAAGFNIVAMSEAEGSNPGTLRKYRRMHGIEYPAHINPKGNHRPVIATAAPPLIPPVDEQLILEGDFAVSSDWHAPVVDYEVLSRFLDDADAANLTRCIIAGDLTNQDALASHEEKQPGADLEAEMQHLCYAITTALDVFDTIIVSWGNHDRHTANKLGVEFDRSIRMLLSDLPADKLARIQVTSRDSVIVRTERGEWLICHTRSYSRLPLAYPNKLALRHGMHIAGGHRHHHAIGIAANGKTIVELGGLLDHERLLYAKRYTNDMPVMANGYMLLVDGRAKCPMLTD
jgi:predicted phosphodiesterase